MVLIAASGDFDTAAMVGIIVNVIFGVLSLLSIIFMVPNNAGKTSEVNKSMLKIAKAGRVS